MVTQTSTIPAVAGVPVARSERKLGVMRSIMGARGPAAFNRLLVASLIVLAATELILYQTAYETVFAVPFGILFAKAAMVLSKNESSKRWLRISGWSCFWLAGLCAFSLPGAISATPVDVECIVSSTVCGALFAGGAFYQLVRLGRAH